MKRFLAFPLLCSCLAAQSEPTTRHGFAATVHPLATQAAVEAMKQGGNAVDGAIAAAVTLGVVDLHNSGIGGGILLLVRKPDGTCVAIDGREMAPAAATKDMFLQDGKADPQRSRVGPLAIAVPGWLAALDHAATRYGTQPLARPFLAAAEIAEAGYIPDGGFGGRKAAWAKEMELFPATSAMLQQPLTEGRLKLPDLANSYRQIAKQGIAWFYRGPFAEQTAAWMQQNKGLLTVQDFADYQVKTRPPLRSTYRGYEILGFPPPSSGGIHVAQILNILETFDLAALGEGSPEFIHTVAEAMKLAFADRAFWLGDADFVPVPRGLMDKAYAKSLAAKIRSEHTTAVPQHGDPPQASEDVFQKHTTHFSVADSAGWWVGATATINNTFGSLVTIPGTGILLNDEMDDFAAQPGAPNVFGLVGAEANSVAPGKRPLSSMSPTIVLKDGRPILVVGGAGGPTIISQVVLAILRVVDFHWTSQAALAAPRFHQQWQPDVLRLESAHAPELRSALEQRGHELKVVPQLGVSQAVMQSLTGDFSGAADPRVKGLAEGF